MVTRVLIPILALLGVLFGIKVMAEGNRPINPAQPITPPASSPYTLSLSGTGLTEASTENLEIAAPVSAVVTEVLVAVGDRIEIGQPLFRLDARELEADLLVREAAVRVAEAQVAELVARPRPEDIPPVEAAVEEAKAIQADAQNQLDLAAAVSDSRAISVEETSRRRYAVGTARARVVTAEAELARTRAGSFKPTIDVARASLEQAKASLQSVKIEIERRTVRSPISGRILQRNIHPGEFAQAGVLSTPLMLVGNTDTMHIRVDIDENDAWRFSEKSSATAYLRGNKEFSTPVRFVRVEPYVVPKRSLTGISTERVDTRVLQVLYAFDADALPVRVGQMMDVYIDDAGKNQTAQSKGTNQ